MLRQIILVTLIFIPSQLWANQGQGHLQASEKKCHDTKVLITRLNQNLKIENKKLWTSYYSLARLNSYIKKLAAYQWKLFRKNRRTPASVQQKSVTRKHQKVISQRNQHYQAYSKQKKKSRELSSLIQALGARSTILCQNSKK